MAEMHCTAMYVYHHREKYPFLISTSISNPSHVQSNPISFCIKEELPEQQQWAYINNN